MTLLHRCVWLFLLVVCNSVPAQTSLVDEELRGLRDADQADRELLADPSRRRDVTQRDGERRKRVLEILSTGRVKSAADYYVAALIFQHSESPDHARLAFAFASLATALQPDNTAVRWLAAAAWDRSMMLANRPQWYGTQYVDGKDAATIVLYRIDGRAVSDEERRRAGIKPLKQLERTKPKP
jgi:hypothetical protein